MAMAVAWRREMATMKKISTNRIISAGEKLKEYHNNGNNNGIAK